MRVKVEGDDIEGAGTSVVTVLRELGPRWWGWGSRMMIFRELVPRWWLYKGNWDLGGDYIKGTGTSVVRVRVEGDGIDGDDFVINELEIRTQRVSNFLFQSFWESVDSFIDFLFTWISIGSQVTNHISRQMDCRFRFSTLNYSGVHVFCLLTLHCSIFFILSKCCNPIG